MIEANAARNCSPVLRSMAFWGMVVLLAWSPFPLGGAIAWAAGLQAFVVAILVLLCVLSILLEREVLPAALPPLGPSLLFLAALSWMLVQALPVVPVNWAHPIWVMAQDALHQSLPNTISVNPWQTKSELIKLVSYLAAGWVAYYLAQRVEFASKLLHAVLIIGVFYAIYAFVLALLEIGQNDLFYSVEFHSPYIAGPFLLHNSFATYAGLVAMVAAPKLFAHGISKIPPARNWQGNILRLLEFTFGRGSILVLATIIPFAAVVASASRAGVAAVAFGTLSVGIISLFTVRRARTLWLVLGVVACLVPLLAVVGGNAETLGARFRLLIDSGNADNVRLALWDAATRMIGDAPLLGLGLGTYQDAYPLYANRVLPFVMDKAHSDYLEFAAGCGLPAAIVWWSALAWLFVLCVRGVIIRHRNRNFAIAAVGAFALVALHSTVDFSLQLPAVALLFSTIVGIGLAQSRSSVRKEIEKAPLHSNRAGLRSFNMQQQLLGPHRRYQ